MIKMQNLQVNLHVEFTFTNVGFKESLALKVNRKVKTYFLSLGNWIEELDLIFNGRGKLIV